MIDSRPDLVSAARFPSGASHLHKKLAVKACGHSFFQSYGVNLPSSLTRVLSSALGFSPYPPVSVCGTVADVRHRSFSRRRDISSAQPTLFGFALKTRIKRKDGFACLSSLVSRRGVPYPRRPDLPRHSVCHTDYQRYRNVRLLPCRLRLSASA